MTGEQTRIDAIAGDAMTRDPLRFSPSAHDASRFPR
jgi:hypothetical protein